MEPWSFIIIIIIIKNLFHEGKTHYSQRLKNLWPSYDR